MKHFEEVERILKAREVRLTSQRKLIVQRAVTYLHFTAEKLVHDVQLNDNSIARGTVYRTLGLLHKIGIIEKHDFHYGAPNYEVTFGKAHHEHLMCLQYGEINEF